MESPSCLFCSSKKERVLVENALAYARYDAYPVSPGHVLNLPSLSDTRSGPSLRA